MPSNLLCFLNYLICSSLLLQEYKYYSILQSGLASYQPSLGNLGKVEPTVECDVADPCTCFIEGEQLCHGIKKECVGCHLEWCTEQPALNLVQFIVGVVILTLGHPFRIALTQSIYSKMLGPIPQVRCSM